MATGGSKDEAELISKGLYRLVSDIIGPEFLVKLRRERWKMMEWMGNNQGLDRVTVFSGSMAERFLMKSSDLDIMSWSLYTVVVENYSQVIHCQRYFKTVLMIDYDYTSQGFALVKCITCDGSNNAVTSSCVQRCGECWVSSKKFMEYYLQRCPSASAHGPCQSGEMFGREYDSAECFQLNAECFWPQQASSAISRMRRCGWPPDDVLQEVIKDGCLLVSVESKKPLFKGASDLEWRISFSLAEKRLIHSMNHCQLLCYGLWKLFLSEVFKKLDGIKDLLCSYFLNTVVFWEMYRNPSFWTPSNFISKFHQTLRLLVTFVNVGYCPNFFIPDNNMFYGKVCGEEQRTLMSYLRSFINEGFLCILKCPSLQNTFLSIIKNLLVVTNISTDESVYLSMGVLRAMTLNYICNSQCSFVDIKRSAHELVKITSVNMDSEFSSIVLGMRKRCLHQNIAERTLHEIILSTNGDRTRHRYLSFITNILQHNKTYLGYGELILAKTFYRLKDFIKAKQAASFVKSKLMDENVMYTWAITEEGVNRIQTRNLTYLQIIEQYVASRFVLDEATTLYELYPEIQARKESIGALILRIPPLVLANFHLILSHHQLNDVIQMYDVLRELHVLVHHDNNFHIKSTHKAISWEILGICHQLCGEYRAAYISYITALNDRCNDFRFATIARINSLQLA